MVTRPDKGGWVVCERRQVSAGHDKIFYLSRRLETKEQASKERERMISLPENEGRLLDITYLRREPARKRKLRDGKRRTHR